MNLGQSIYRLRTQQHLSQSELADALCVSRQSVSKWETGSAVPDLDKLIRLSQIFGVSLDQLVQGTSAAETQAAPSDPEKRHPLLRKRHASPGGSWQVPYFCSLPGWSGWC